MWWKELSFPLGGQRYRGSAAEGVRAVVYADTCTCTQIESLHVAGTRRVFACVIIQSAFVIIAWANPACRRVFSWAC